MPIPSIAASALARGRPARSALLLAIACALSTSCASGDAAATPASTDPFVGAPAHLRYEIVRAIHEDRKGNFWFGSWNEGVCRYDGRSHAYFTVEDGLSDGQIRAIREDENGVVWFECGSGLRGFDGEKLVAPGPRSYETPQDWKLAKGDVWFKEDGAVGATAQESRPGVYRYDGSTFQYLWYPVPEDRSQASGFATTCMATGKNGRLWFATYKAVFGYDGAELTILDESSLGLERGEGRLHVRAVFEDSKGRLWIGNNGIGVLLRDDKGVVNFTQHHGLGRTGMHGDRTFPLPGDAPAGVPTMHRVFAIGEDRNGHMWFGTVESGLWRWDGASMKHFTAADGLTTKDVFCIYTDRRGDLWVSGQGVFRFDGAKFDRVQ